jgi:uncharacterized phage protein (TIGR02218 family)
MLLELRATDGTVIKLTSHDVDVGDYLSDFGLDIAVIAMQLGGGGNSTTATVLPDFDGKGGVTIPIIEGGLLDGCWAQVSLIDWAKPGATPFILSTCYVNEAKYANAGKLELTLMTPLNKARPLCGDIVSQMCRADFGDALCGINIDDGMIDKPHVEAPINEQAFVLSNDEQTPKGFYNNGTVQFETGANAGLGYEILTITNDPSQNDNETLFTKVPMTFPVAAGDQLTLIPGCDKVLTSGCRYWHNEHNFQGEPYTYDRSNTLADGCDIFLTGATGNDGIGIPIGFPVNVE